MADIGSAYLVIFPSMKGFGSKLTSELGSVDVSSIGDRMGDQLGDGISDGMGRAAKGTSGFSGRLSALSGAVMGVAGEIAGRLFDAVASLGGEMVEASDSAQKFESTLSFAGIDDSTIAQLTASTQEYADRTVYDLADIRNATAQLAANGVKDYAQLAEAAGNLNAVAGGNADTFKSVSMVMSQTAGSGKLMTENWNQLTDAIPGASGALQEAMRSAGAFEGNFRDAMENGEISADEFFAAVQKLGMQDVAVQAATSTSTIEGALGNLQASVVGVGSQLITALSPAITGAMNLLTGFVSRLPAAFQALATAATFLADNMGGILPVLTGLVAGFVAFRTALGISALIQTVTTALNGMSIAQALVTTAQKALNVVMSANPFTLVVTLIAGVVTALVTLWSTNEEFRAAVTEAWNAILAAGSAVWGSITGFFTETIPDAIQTAQEWFFNLPGNVRAALDEALSAIASWASGVVMQAAEAGSGFLNGLRSKLEEAVAFVTSIPSRITDIFSGAGSWLVESGRALLQGFADGVMGAVGWVGDQISGALSTIRSFFPFSPAKRGPFSGHGYTTWSGKALMRDWGAGMISGGPAAVRAVDSVMADVRGAFERNAVPAAALSASSKAVASYEPYDKRPGGQQITQNFNTRVVRSDEDLYTVAPVIYRNATREARMVSAW